MSKVINTEKLAVKEATYLKNPAKYNAKSKNRPVVIRRDDGSTIDLKEYRLRPIYVKERYYLANPAKYDAIFGVKVYIVCKGGIQYLLDDYKTLQIANKENLVLPDSGFAHSIVNNKKIKEHKVTYEDECNCNHCNTLHLFVWWDQSLLEKQGNYVVLKSHPNCYVTNEGIFNIDTCLLTPSYIALIKYASLNKLEAYFVATTFLQQANKDNIKSIIRYTAKHFGFGYMPSVPQDALNYILEDNILGVQKGGYTTLFGILKSKFHISNEVIWEMIKRNLIMVDSKYNIAFLTWDENGNVISIYKMSIYNHKEWCFNHYATKSNVNFIYCSEEADRYNTFNAITVFDHPLELLSYLTLEIRTDPLVTSLMDGCCYMAMFNSNTVSVKEWLNKHDEVNTLNIATRFIPVNKYINEHLHKIASDLKVPKTQELNQLIVAYSNRAELKPYCDSFRLDGWNTLIKFNLNMLTAYFNPITEYEIKHYETK